MENAKPNKLIINHEEAIQYAHVKAEESNLARCYIDIMRKNERLRGAILSLSCEAMNFGVVASSVIHNTARKAGIEVKVDLSNKHSVPSWEEVKGILADCQICKTTPCVCDRQPKTSVPETEQEANEARLDRTLY